MSSTIPSVFVFVLQCISLLIIRVACQIRITAPNKNKKGGSKQGPPICRQNPSVGENHHAYRLKASRPEGLTFRAPTNNIWDYYINRSKYYYYYYYYLIITNTSTKSIILLRYLITTITTTTSTTTSTATTTTTAAGSTSIISLRVLQLRRNRNAISN
jgi:hypothetical protein